MSMLVNPFRHTAAGGGGGGGGGGHSYWRLMILSNQGNASITGLNEVEMRATAGGADQCSGGTPSVSNSGAGGSAANVFDNSLTTTWAATGATNQWVAYQFASPVDVQEVALTISSGLNGIDRAPKSCEVQWSDDGSTWTTAFSFTWDSPLYGSTRTFPQSAFASGFARAWRINVTANGGDSITYVREAEFRATAGGTDQTVPVLTTVNGNTSGRGIGTSGTPWGMFDNNTASGSWGDSASPLAWAGFVFPDPVKVEEITITNMSSLTRSPTAFTFDWLDQDGVTWRTQKTVSGLTWSSVGQTKIISVI